MKIPNYQNDNILQHTLCIKIEKFWVKEKTWINSNYEIDLQEEINNLKGIDKKQKKQKKKKKHYKRKTRDAEGGGERKGRKAKQSIKGKARAWRGLVRT